MKSDWLSSFDAAARSLQTLCATAKFRLRDSSRGHDTLFFCGCCCNTTNEQYLPSYSGVNLQHGGNVSRVRVVHYLRHALWLLLLLCLYIRDGGSRIMAVYYGAPVTLCICTVKVLQWNRGRESRVYKLQRDFLSFSPHYRCSGRGASRLLREGTDSASAFVCTARL